MAEACATFCERAHALAQAFWPGPLTLVLHPSPSSPLSPLVNQSAVGVSLRFPANQISCALVAEVGSPLTASSANVSGALPPITAADAISGLGSSVALAIDGGKAKQAIESTILDLTGKTPKLLRTGSISPLSIKNVVGRLATDTRRFD